MYEGQARTLIMEERDAQELLRLQLDTCRRYDLPDCAPEDMVAVAISTLGKMPVYGTRISLPAGGNVSWFFHCGEYSDAADFYQPVHTDHLAELLPAVIKYLRLPHGSKFIIDDNGFEDVWLVQ
ncbi:immunity protein Imm33 domain-containing protein [Burkholderia multivorans]|uniref:immunity protein Imm33 domain-containing protein n=3 Tax=Burkholderia multivorans TaxID=87883 RepID=UPI003BFA6F02